jgi:hypothetical protein
VPEPTPDPQPEPTLAEIARRLEAFAWHFEVDASEFAQDEPAYGGYMRTAAWCRAAARTLAALPAEEPRERAEEEGR